MAKKQRKKWLDDDVVAALEPDTKQWKAYEVADGFPGRQSKTGLLVRVQPTDTKIFYATFKVAGAGDGVFMRGGQPVRRAGPTRRVRLGQFPNEMLTADARAKAEEYRRAAGKGIDPLPKDDAPMVNGTPQTIRQLAEAYRTSGISRNIINVYPRLRDVVVEKWGDRTPEQVDQQTFLVPIREYIAQGEYPAGRSLRDAMRQFYNDMCPGVPNPAHELPRNIAKALLRKKKVNTDYSDAELQAFWAITEDWGDKRTGMQGRFGLVARFALLTGVRSSALASLRWSNVKEDHIVLDPPEDGSGKRWPTALPKTPGICRLIEAAEPHRRDDTDLVFWTRRRDGTFEGALPKAITLRKRAGERLNGKTIKELRHTAATRMGEAGVRTDLIKVLTAHSDGTLDIYNKATYLEPLRAALPKWEAALEEVLNADD